MRAVLTLANKKHWESSTRFKAGRQLIRHPLSRVG